MSDENPLSGLSDDELKGLAADLGLDVSLPADLAHEGLGDLTPDERAKLDALVASDRPEPPPPVYTVEDTPPDPPALTDRQEQELRDFYGYGPSEKRTKAERDGAAKRMLANIDTSQTHPAVTRHAALEIEREKRLRPIREAFIAARKRKEQK